MTKSSVATAGTDDVAGSVAVDAGDGGDARYCPACGQPLVREREYPVRAGDDAPAGRQDDAGWTPFDVEESSRVDTWGPLYVWWTGSHVTRTRWEWSPKWADAAR